MSWWCSELQVNLSLSDGPAVKATVDRLVQSRTTEVMNAPSLDQKGGNLHWQQAWHRAWHGSWLDA